jgi:hypothetical protein
MQQIEAPTSITLDGKEIPLANFSETVQRLVAIHTEWRNELAAERLAVAKTEAAIRALDAELSATVQKELAPPEEAAPAVDTAPAATADAPAAVQ